MGAKNTDLTSGVSSADLLAFLGEQKPEMRILFARRFGRALYPFLGKAQPAQK
ncbi:hypothetical protein [Faecalibaculum rodentium]|uniref:hypothetical protein n=1 Tax=Faecalibaculum rodentium TaxID=1702221 RepID=UPI0025A0A15A|nr:hypothetical protein [Faecalibaculum rodentium]